jgi:hypothetical protein
MGASGKSKKIEIITSCSNFNLNILQHSISQFIAYMQVKSIPSIASHRDGVQAKLKGLPTKDINKQTPVYVWRLLPSRVNAK